MWVLSLRMPSAGLKPANAPFLPEERQWLENLKDWGLQDSFRDMNGDDNSYSWYDYRSRGFEQEPKRGLRIDLILASPALMKLLSAAVLISMPEVLKSPRITALFGLIWDN